MGGFDEGRGLHIELWTLICISVILHVIYAGVEMRIICSK
jgi:hypothetical protein